MIYEYNEKEKIVKIDDRTVYLTVSEDRLFKKLYKSDFAPIGIEDINQLLWSGHATDSFIEDFIRRLEKKLGISIKLL